MKVYVWTAPEEHKNIYSGPSNLKSMAGQVAEKFKDRSGVQMIHASELGFNTPDFSISKELALDNYSQLKKLLVRLEFDK